MEPSSTGLQASTFPLQGVSQPHRGQVYSKGFLNAGACPVTDRVPHGGVWQCTLLGYTWICRSVTPLQRVLHWGQEGRGAENCRYRWTLENCPTLGSWLGCEALCLRGAVCLSDRATPKVCPGGRDAPARKDAERRGLNQVSTQLESWCPGSTVISVWSCPAMAPLCPVPHSHNRSLHGPHSPLPRLQKQPRL